MENEQKKMEHYFLIMSKMYNYLNGSFEIVLKKNYPQTYTSLKIILHYKIIIEGAWFSLMI
jgi:hypothetical protein